ncbi:hypothetical protein ACWDSJ_23075 [Nocardia sp. NPDC003482]
MITRTSWVASWWWGVPHAAPRAEVAGETLAALLEVLADARLSNGIVPIKVGLWKSGRKTLPGWNTAFRVGGDSSCAEFVEMIRRDRSYREIHSISLYARCSPVIFSGDELVYEEDSIALSVGVNASLTGAELQARLYVFSDAWLEFDLKGMPQPSIFAANAPRLRGVLEKFSEFLQVEVYPNDPTLFAVPTQVGVDNHRQLSGQVSDVWFDECSMRADRFRRRPHGYAERMRAVAARNDSVTGRSSDVVLGDEILGCIWVSEEAEAIGYAARDIESDRCYSAGLVWVDRLERAYHSGMGAQEAFVHMAGFPADPVAGVLNTRAVSSRIDVLELLE